MRKKSGKHSQTEYPESGNENLNPLNFDPADPGRPLTREENRILSWVETVRFRHVFFGGVREQDVFAKIEELQRLYISSLCAERARYDALLEAYRRGNAVPAADAADDSRTDDLNNPSSAEEEFSSDAEWGTVPGTDEAREDGVSSVLGAERDREEGSQTSFHEFKNLRKNGTEEFAWLDDLLDEDEPGADFEL